MKPILYAAFAGLLVFSGCANNKTEAPKPEPVVECVPGVNGYAAKVSPIITAKCNTPGCHNAGSSNLYHFDTYEGLKAKINDGSFEERVFIRKDMPPTGNLTEEELKTLRCWVNNGALKN